MLGGFARRRPDLAVFEPLADAQGRRHGALLDRKALCRHRWAWPPSKEKLVARRGLRLGPQADESRYNCRGSSWLSECSIVAAGLASICPWIDAREMKLRVGLIGLGEAWETRHRPALRSLADRFEVRAICDQVARRAEQAAQEFGAAAVDGFRALSTREDIDALLMLSEPWYGSLPILAACDAGKALYCAVTPNLDPEEALTLKNRVQQSGIAFMAEFPAGKPALLRLRLKEFRSSRDWVSLRLLFCHRRVPVKEGPPARVWSKTKAPEIRDLVELVDWCRYVVGRDPTSVFGLAHNATPDGNAEDYNMMSLDFSGPRPAGTDVAAQISCGTYMPVQWEEAVTFRSPPALASGLPEWDRVRVDLPSTLIWFDPAGRHQESLESERPVGEQLLSQFYRSVTSLVRNPSGLEDAYQS